MPVIIKPSPEKAGTNTDEAASNSQELLKKASSGWAQPGGGNRDVTIVETEKRRIIQSSFSDIGSSAQKVIPYGNGFVNGKKVQKYRGIQRPKPRDPTPKLPGPSNPIPHITRR
jgi:hypothetical protein